MQYRIKKRDYFSQLIEQFFIQEEIDPNASIYIEARKSKNKSIKLDKSYIHKV